MPINKYKKKPMDIFHRLCIQNRGDICMQWNNGNDLSFRLVAKQVFSALRCLTSVFGMLQVGPSR